MKYVVQYGYWEYDGLKVFDSEEDAADFLIKEAGIHTKRKKRIDLDGWWWRLYKAESFELVDSNENK